MPGSRPGQGHLRTDRCPARPRSGPRRCPPSRPGQTEIRPAPAPAVPTRPDRPPQTRADDRDRADPGGATRSRWSRRDAVRVSRRRCGRPGSSRRTGRLPSGGTRRRGW
ncbi:hypothetical protein B5D80_07220 [Micromonospora wenchangensis]|uniref:Uncharacterized protein n=1 Tax=Micromonospora wenchangensis TaxID=1185415 RepID=A0A246RQ91_9ACTN|nr:hypothetical protein B5D80_07220 [Micromonospora wenchangensis]